jgi:hypothetical protein
MEHGDPVDGLVILILTSPGKEENENRRNIYGI